MSVGKKKSYEVMVSTRAPVKGIGVNGKWHKFDKNGMFVTHDAALARDIKQTYGQDSDHRSVIVTEVDDLHPSYENRGGRRVRSMFTVPHLPWKDE